MKLAVGFLTYNESSARYLGDFLPSLEAALSFLSPSERLVLAFDNSTGDLANRRFLERFNQEALTRPDGLKIEILSVEDNLGFSRAYNILIRQALAAGAEYFLVINPDVILEKNALSEMIASLEADSGLASVSPKLRRWDFATNTRTSCLDSCGLALAPGLRFSDIGQGCRDDKGFDRHQILGPSGAAALFRLSWLEKVGEGGQYFDERFFMYKEDCDLAYRLYLAGGRSRLVPTAIIYHDRTAASAGKGLFNKLSARSNKSRQVRSWSFRNQHLLFLKHWTSQGLYSRLLIIIQVLSMFIFSLIFERFLLKEYRWLRTEAKVLTNIK